MSPPYTTSPACQHVTLCSHAVQTRHAVAFQRWGHVLILLACLFARDMLPTNSNSKAPHQHAYCGRWVFTTIAQPVKAYLLPAGLQQWWV